MSTHFTESELDHCLILNERHLHRIVKEYQGYFNQARPHQGIEQRIPCQPERLDLPPVIGKITSRPVLRGLHHDYYWLVIRAVRSASIVHLTTTTRWPGETAPLRWIVMMA